MMLRMSAMMPALSLLFLLPPSIAQTAGSSVTFAKGTLPDSMIPSYDVISIKPNKTSSGRMSINIDDGNFEADNISLKTLLLNAFDLKEAQLVGLSGWANSARFDIRAKVLDPDKKIFDAMTDDQERRMLIPILTERFQLKFHREQKSLPVYDLVVAKEGPKFVDSKVKDDGESKGETGMTAGSMRVNNTELTSTAISMEALVGMLSGRLQRVVIDKTGLKGRYDLDLKWSPSDGAPTADNAPPEIFTALQEQLGLKLVPSKADIQTFVVDQISQPTEN